MLTLPSSRNNNSRSLGNRKYKVAIFTHNISHFEAPFYRALAAHPAVDLTVYYHNDLGIVPRFDPLYGRVIDWGVPLDQGFRSKFLPQPTYIVRELSRGKYDALILYGYADRSKLVALVACKALRVNVLFRGTGTLLDPPRFPHSAIKSVVLKALFGLCDAFLVGGRYNADYFRHYSVTDRKMFFVPFSVDLEHFKNGSMQWRRERGSIRRTLGLTGDKVALFVGTLTPKKGPHIFLNAAKVCLQAGVNASFVFAGDGPMRLDLEEYVTTNNLDRFVRFTGFLSQQDLPKVYAVADVAVFPSLFQETWARAINEAMACGLPVIASRRAGATGDIVKDGVNGFIVEEGDVSKLAAAMIQVLRDQSLREAMGKASSEIIANWDYRLYVHAVVDALSHLPFHGRS